ncbi:MAG TPA: sensor histidine kinase KdpD [Candidatus Polarisedimenticolaceae bacterium]|nr:sensor histidine kinase KdpD [Candidatus Polarisedimenticolaceae bacterium]
MASRRPDPDALLRRVRQEEGERSRGRLRIFFGASPGVGKTYAMLEAARREKGAGLDVVAGWVETHGRAETATLLEGMETLPPREVDYRGVRLREFDLDGALARRPSLLLLDELAHTNAPGSRHLKRWQDARELLEAGIDVWSTLNVQHLASMADLVTQVTEAPVREIVPDSVMDDADTVEFVDLPPDDLLERLREGKVYVPDVAQRAARNFFRKGNLIALRELALRRTAERVEVDVRDYHRAHEVERAWPVAERILVCIRPNPETARLVQAGRRLAGRLRADWVVAHVETRAQPALSPAERQTLASAFKLAEDLGAETTVLRGETVSEALLAYARAHSVSKIVVGKPARPRWRDRLFGSPVDAMVRAAAEIDVFVVSGAEETPKQSVRRPRPRGRSSRTGHLWAMAVTALCTAVCWLLGKEIDRSNLIMIYLLGVVFVATRHGRWPAVTSAVLGVAAFDFFFVPPHLTFAVSDTQYVVTFAVMLTVALLISGLAARAVEQAEAAHQRGRRTQLLYAASRELAELSDPAAIARAGARRVAEVMRGEAAVLLPDGTGGLRAPEGSEGAPFADRRERAVADWVFQHGRNAGRGTDTLSGAGALYLPLPGSERPVGVLAVRPEEAMLPLGPTRVELLETLARLIAAPLERGRLSMDAEAERLRNTLLSSVSHDLRTPLAAITGAASSLMGEPTLDPEVRLDLAQTIHEEAARLDRRVRNLLDMTRLDSGAVRPAKDWHSLEEVVGSALRRVARALEDRRVTTDLPADLPLLRVDASLLEQVLVNLLENAAKYTPPGSTVRVSAERFAEEVQVEVADDGPGLTPGDEQRVFEKFFREPRARGGGFGLGLAISRAIVEAHGGRIRAENLARGVAFRFTLPLELAPSGPGEEAVDEPA